MCRINDDLIGQRHYFFTQRIIEPAGEILLRQARRFLSQIGATHISDKKRIPGKEGIRFSRFIIQQIACTLRRVAWCVEDFYF